MLTNSGLLAWYLFVLGGASERAHFFFALLPILSTSLMYKCHEQVAASTAELESLMRTNHPTLFVLLPQFLSYTKNIVAFEFVALRASCYKFHYR